MGRGFIVKVAISSIKHFKNLFNITAKHFIHFVKEMFYVTECAAMLKPAISLMMYPLNIEIL